MLAGRTELALAANDRLLSPPLIAELVVFEELVCPKARACRREPPPLTAQLPRLRAATDRPNSLHVVDHGIPLRLRKTGCVRLDACRHR